MTGIGERVVLLVGLSLIARDLSLTLTVCLCMTPYFVNMPGVLTDEVYHVVETFSAVVNRIAEIGVDDTSGFIV